MEGCTTKNYTARYVCRVELMTVIESIQTWIAWHLPKGIVYWCAIRLGVHATTGEYSDQIVPELTIADALKRWR